MYKSLFSTQNASIIKKNFESEIVFLEIHDKKCLKVYVFKKLLFKC